MSANKVWDLKIIPKRTKTVDCKWVYKTKYDSQENIERFKTRFIVKGFTQSEGLIIMRRFLQSHIWIPLES
jgi:hypothetical protein